MSKKRNRYEYYRGKPGAKYGIYNTVQKQFQFGISEDTPMLAEARLFYLIGDDARKYRFEPRPLPPDGLRTKVSLIDEMHELKPIEMLPASKKASVHLYYSEEEAGQLYELLNLAMDELSQLNAEDKISDGTLFEPEERETLHKAMRFCCEQMLALAKYANVGDIEG